MDNLNRLGKFIKNNPTIGRVLMWVLCPAYLAYGAYLGITEGIEEFADDYRRIFK